MTQSGSWCAISQTLIPVIDQGGRLVGIISQADVAIRVHERETTAEMVEEISRAA
jgi:CBS-domain-containing membrane protein